MKIGFDLQLDEAPLFIEMAKKLYNEYGIQVSGVTLGRRWMREIKNSPLKVYNVTDFIKELFKREILPSEIDYYNKKYGEFGLNRAFHIDRFLKNRTRSELLKWIIGHLKFYEYYFAKEELDYFVGPGVAYLTHLIAYLVGKSQSIDYLAMMCTRIPNSRFVICRNLQDSWDKVKKIHLELKEKNILPSKESVSFVNQFREFPTKPSYANLDSQKISILKSQIVKFFKRIKQYYIEGWRREQFDYYTHPLMYYVTRELKRIIKARLLKKAKFFYELNPDEKFILFPLHYQPESSTEVQARFFVDQISVVENIAKCIPITHFLYVKEHLGAFGRRHCGYYQRIIRIPNIRLIHPEENTYELIKKSDLIVTLTSTVGWEALLLNKPVITLGDVFYNDSGLTYRVNSYQELEDTIIKIISEKKNIIDEEIFEKKLALFVDAIFQGSYEGEFDVPGLNPLVMFSKNVDLLTKGLLKEIGFLNDIV